MAQIRARSDWSRAGRVAQDRQGLSGVREGLRESPSGSGRLEPRKKRFHGRFSANTATGAQEDKLAETLAWRPTPGPAILCPRLTENCPSRVTRIDATRGQLASPSGGGTHALSHDLCRLSRRSYRPARGTGPSGPSPGRKRYWVDGLVSGPREPDRPLLGVAYPRERVLAIAKARTAALYPGVGAGAPGDEPRALGAGREGLDLHGRAGGELHGYRVVGHVVRCGESDVDITLLCDQGVDGIKSAQPPGRAG